MKSNNYLQLLLLLVAMAAVSCTTSREYASTEYDDVYYNSTDESNVRTNNQTTSNSQNGEPFTNESSYERNRAIYQDPSVAYADDDFYFSRRIRRFDQPNFQSWRYFDPFFANDLYFVMGTPSWARWNSLGWYSWNRPRFGTAFSLSFYNDPFFFSPRPFNTWAWNSFNYFDPFVSAYYGYDPYFGYAGYDPFWGWNRPYFNSFYCPPVNYGLAGVRNTFVQPRVVGYRNSRTAIVSPTNYNRNPKSTTVSRQEASNGVVTTAARRPNTSTTSSRYFRPLTDDERIPSRVTTNGSNSNRSNVGRRPTSSGAPVYTSPSRRNNSRNNSPTNISSRDQSRNSTRNQDYRRPSNSSRNSTARPSRSSSPSRNYSSPSRNSSSSGRSSSSVRPSRSSSSSSSSSGSRRPSSSSSRRP